VSAKEGARECKWRAPASAKGGRLRAQKEGAFERRRSRSRSDPSSDTRARATRRYINKGGLLGDLPSLGSPSQPAAGGSAEKSKKKSKKKKSPDKKKKRKNDREKERSFAATIPKEEVPEKFRCKITQRLMQQPVLTPSKYHADASVLKTWFSKQGHCCPITGTPLSMQELIRDRQMEADISHWLEEKRRELEGGGGSGGGAGEEAKIEGGEAGTDDDAYNF
jgi:hypothetical protein